MSTEKLYLAPSKIAGTGVFAKENIEVGAHILAFEGRLISLEEAIAKGGRESDALQIEPQWYMDLIAPGVLVNHSCKPNAGIINDRNLFAISPIAAGEELSYDYSTTMDEESWHHPCTCGNPDCRGVISDFKTLPLEVQARYLSMGIVQEFIARKCRSALGGLNLQNLSL